MRTHHANNRALFILTLGATFLVALGVSPWPAGVAWTPGGLGTADAPWAPKAARAQELHGFVEGLTGVRTAEGDGFETGSLTAEEVRLQLRSSGYSDEAEYFARVDFLYDAIETEEPQYFEIREAWAWYTGWSAVDFKVGRQINTWGTGDLLFINDVFPRDWQSFFIGREYQYLKAPQNTLRVNWFPSFSDVNLILTPGFTPSRLPEPNRLAFYDPFGGTVPIEEPSNNIENGEVALRLARTLGSWDLALYGYWGRYRRPLAIEPDGMGNPQALVYPRLNVYGASVIGNFLSGVTNLEVGYYDSREDKDGDNPLVENSTFQGMWGYNRQVASDTQIGIQGFYEWITQYQAYQDSRNPGAPELDEVRQLYTLRFTQFFSYQTVAFRFFTYWSPTDEDMYARASLSWKMTDQFEVVLGTNLFAGNKDWTMFGQLDANDNVYARARYSF